jgi:hypothetical protein
MSGARMSNIEAGFVDTRSLAFCEGLIAGAVVELHTPGGHHDAARRLKRIGQHFTEPLAGNWVPYDVQ